MSTSVFKKNIEILDFSFIEKNKNEEGGVFLTDKFESALDKNTTINGNVSFNKLQIKKENANIRNSNQASFSTHS